jgi:hypothetical protein
MRSFGTSLGIAMANDSARYSRRGEQHGKKQKPAAKKDLAKKRSSSSPRRLRSTPMNHGKAMPANGTRLSARATWVELVLSHAPRLQRIGSHRKLEQYEAGNQENRKEDADDGDGARRLQACTGQSCFLLHHFLEENTWRLRAATRVVRKNFRDLICPMEGAY